MTEITPRCPALKYCEPLAEYENAVEGLRQIIPDRKIPREIEEREDEIELCVENNPDCQMRRVQFYFILERLVRRHKLIKSEGLLDEI
jgi:hypothetical protein